MNNNDEDGNDFAGLVQPNAVEIPLRDRIHTALEQLIAQSAELRTKLTEAKTELAGTKAELADYKQRCAELEAEKRSQTSGGGEANESDDGEEETEGEEGGDGSEDGEEMEEEESTDGENEAGDGEEEEVQPDQVNIGNAQRRFRCTHCEYSSKWKHNLPKHERIHTGERPYKCRHCPRTFVQTASLCRHEKTVHHVRKEHKLQCHQNHNRCPYATDSHADLIAHRRRCHR